MEELHLGPNGGLLFCMEYHPSFLFFSFSLERRFQDRSMRCVFGLARYLVQQISWLEENVAGYEEDYLIFDCPGV